MGRDSDARAPGRHLRLATPGAAPAVGVLIVVMLAAAAVISSVSHQFKLSGIAQVALFLPFAVVGIIVAWNQPRNPMGWVLLGITFFLVLTA
jgi:hypothetical protein